MVEEIATQPELTTPSQPQTENRLRKYLLFGILGFLLLASASYAGYWYGVRNEKLQLKTQNLTPTQIPVATLTPTFPPETTPSSDETAGWKTYSNPKHGYEFKYPTEATIVDVDGFGGCIMVKMDFARLSLKSPGVAAGGCVVTGRGALETYEPISETIQINGQTYVAKGDREDSLKNPDAKIRFREFFRIEDLNEINDFIVEYGGSYNPSDVNAYQAEKELTKKILSTFKFLD